MEDNSKQEDLVDVEGSIDPSAASSASHGPGERVEKGKGKEVESSEAMSDSVATLVPPRPAGPTTPTDSTPKSHFLAEPSSYIDPTPPTPRTSQPPSRSPSTAARTHQYNDRSAEHSPSRADTEDDEKRYTSEEDQEVGGPRLEIQSIMDQFSESGGGPGADEVMSPRLEIASPILGSPVQHPPRKSSLEPLAPSLVGHLQTEVSNLHISPTAERSVDHGPPVPPKDAPRSQSELSPTQDSASAASVPLHRPPPPEPEPEPAQPFDFHSFLEDLRNKKADPVARYLKSFLSEFAKKQWMVHEQVKIIGDFLAFIENKMVQCETWRNKSDSDFDNAREGMEKLVMNRLYSQTFSPAIPPPKPVPGAKPKKKGGEVPMGPGRRGQHQEDVERDDVLTQKINIYSWVKEDHLDIPPINESGRRFLRLAQQELLKIKSYRAPRDKIICVLNCCKVIFGLLKHNKSDGSADSFMPMLIYVVLQCNPEHLVSNVQYILRFRNQEKLGGEAGYYLSSLMGVIQFIENMDRTTLTITDDEFEKNVEAAVSAIAEKHQANSPLSPQQPVFHEKEGLRPTDPTLARPSLDGTDASGTNTPRRSYESDTGDALTTGILRTIQKPLSTIGRMFSDEPGPSTSYQAGHHNAGAISEGLPNPPRVSSREPPPPQRPHPERSSSRQHPLSAEEAAARQASAETAEAQRLQRAEHANVVETLASMFPDLDKDLISDVVYQKEGRVGLAVDACLALST